MTGCRRAWDVRAPRAGVMLASRRPPHKPGHDILAIRGDLRRPDLKEKSLPLRTENSLFFSYIIISGHRSMRLKPGRLNAPPAERVSWPGLRRIRHCLALSRRRCHAHWPVLPDSSAQTLDALQ